MSVSWLSYIPYHVAQDLLADPTTAHVGREQRFDAVALFADVSGFTRMSEALGQAGRAGTEELTDILNDYFSPMIDLIQSYGGIVGKFGGDAMTVLFPYTEATRTATVRRSIHCALDMQANMHRYEAISTSAGTFSLAMKAGLAMGPVFCTTAGDPDSRLEYVIAGDVLDRCADAEHYALQGEVVAHNALLDEAGPMDTVKRRGDFSCIARLDFPVEHAPLHALGPVTDDAVWALRCYLPPVIAQRVTTGQTDFIDEHRKVTVVFVSFEGFDYDRDPDVGHKLQTYLSSVIRSVERFDGYLNKVDMGDKGSKYVVLFGAPVAHENDEERAVLCALELSALAIPARIGINNGFVYCGHVGSESRREYTVIGDAVNVAARLMQAAGPGDLLISSTVQNRIPDTIRCEPLPPLQVKGKAEPVDVCLVSGMQAQSTQDIHAGGYALPMIGRQSELQQVLERLTHTLHGNGQIVGISAEAGMGKSRLMVEIARAASEQGITCLGGACESYGTNISYLVWHAIWQSFFGIDPDAAPGEQRRYLERWLADVDPALVQRMPLLGVALNLPIPDTELTQSLDAQLRVELLQSLLLTCLRARAAEAPLVFFLEDCHWIDPLSQELLDFIGRNVADLSVMVVLLYRPPSPNHNPLAQIAQFSHFHELPLSEFTYDEAQQLIELKLAQLFETEGAVPSELVDRVTAKAQGNPFYIEEMINLIHDRRVDPQDQHAWQRIDLPDSLHSLIMSRIDQLQEDEKITLKVASVIGRVFRARWVWGAYPPVGTPDDVQQVLNTLSRLDLTPLDKPEPELEYIFRHITTQEVAYESLAFSMRAALHEHVGAFIETTYPDALDRYLDVLALHYGRSRNTEKQRVYFVRAGDAAMAAYANDAAIDYYQRALLLVAGDDRSDLRRKLGDIWQLTGKWDEAETSYRDAMKLAETAGDGQLKAQCQSALGHLLWHKKSYDEALHWLEQAESIFEDQANWHGVGQVAGYTGYIYWEQGDYAQALAHFERQLQIATDHDDKPGIGDATGNIGILYSEQGDYERALACYEQQLQIATESGNRQGILYAVVNIGNVYVHQGNNPRGLSSFKEALRIANEMGYLRAAGVIIGNSGEVYRLQGDFERALACYERALSIVSELGDLTMTLVTVGNLATVNAAQGQFADAEQLFTHAIALARAVNIPYFLCEYLHGMAEMYCAQDNHDSASLNDEALSIAQQVGRKEIEFKAQVTATRLADPQNDPSAAIERLTALLAEWPEDAEQAALYYEIWRADGAQNGACETAARLYHTLYERTPNIEYRERYEALTGDRLPDPPALPALADDLVQDPERLNTLCVRVAELSERLAESPPA